jgi:hypothetical protein
MTVYSVVFLGLCIVLAGIFIMNGIVRHGELLRDGLTELDTYDEGGE